MTTDAERTPDETERPEKKYGIGAEGRFSAEGTAPFAFVNRHVRGFSTPNSERTAKG
jgi:hypothetical protein